MYFNNHYLEINVACTLTSQSVSPTYSLKHEATWKPSINWYVGRYRRVKQLEAAANYKYIRRRKCWRLALALYHLRVADVQAYVYTYIITVSRKLKSMNCNTKIFAFHWISIKLSEPSFSVHRTLHVNWKAINACFGLQRISKSLAVAVATYTYQT